jgi:hypothetical protein
MAEVERGIARAIASALEGTAQPADRAKDGSAAKRET